VLLLRYLLTLLQQDLRARMEVSGTPPPLVPACLPACLVPACLPASNPPFSCSLSRSTF
jgi:hypothetical protein